MKVMSEARFLAGEDARDALVVLEPETALSNEHLDALQDCGAAGFVSDGSSCFFERPDEAPDLVYDRMRYPKLLSFAVAPRFGVRLRTWAAKNDPAFRVRVDDGGRLSLVIPPAPARRDRSRDPEVSRDEIVAKLRELGIKDGDTLMVHSSLSACGRIVGGAKTVIDALIEAVGEDGNFFLPSFQRSECYLNGAISTRWDHRPADASRRDSESIRWVGTIPLEFMRLYPDAPRGSQISHSWTGWGRRAAEALALQRWDDPPFGETSLPRQVLKMNGKVLHFGSTIARTSFIHCIEHHLALPGYSAPAFFQMRLANGDMAWKGIEGCYCGSRISTTKNESAPIYREALSEGLKIRKVRLGVGTLMLMDCVNYWDALCRVFRRSPGINLGTN